jgi:hypothetical protein
MVPDHHVSDLRAGVDRHHTTSARGSAAARLDVNQR